MDSTTGSGCDLRCHPLFCCRSWEETSGCTAGCGQFYPLTTSSPPPVDPGGSTHNPSWQYEILNNDCWDFCAWKAKNNLCFPLSGLRHQKKSSLQSVMWAPQTLEFILIYCCKRLQHPHLFMFTLVCCFKDTVMVNCIRTGMPVQNKTFEFER